MISQIRSADGSVPEMVGVYALRVSSLTGRASVSRDKACFMTGKTRSTFICVGWAMHIIKGHGCDFRLISALSLVGF